MLAEEERIAFLTELGYGEPGLAILTRAAYSLLGLETYFTAGKQKPCLDTEGCKLHRQRVIHSDFEKGLSGLMFTL